MPTVDSSGTLTADGTEQTLGDLTGNKYYSAHINLVNMASGDTTVVKLYVKVLSTGSAGLYSSQTYYDAQTNKLVFIPPQPSTQEWKLTLTQTAGTNRDYDWVIYKV